MVIGHQQSVGETMDAEHPRASLIDPSCNFLRKSAVGLNPYLPATASDGKLSNVHMPSSARAASALTTINNNQTIVWKRLIGVLLRPISGLMTLTWHVQIALTADRTKFSHSLGA